MQRGWEKIDFSSLNIRAIGGMKLMGNRTGRILRALGCLTLCLATAQCGHHRPPPPAPPTLDNINPNSPSGVAIELYRALLSGDRDKLADCIDISTPQQEYAFEAICEYAGAVADLRAAAVKRFGSDDNIPGSLTAALADLPHARTTVQQGSVIIVATDGSFLAALITVSGKWKISLPMQASFAGESLNELANEMQMIAGNLDGFRSAVEAGKFDTVQDLADALDAADNPPPPAPAAGGRGAAPGVPMPRAQ
jgi:hypothetical protein